MAIILAVKNPATEVLGISTVSGNYPIDVTTKNACKVVELLGVTDVPLARGMSKPLFRDLPEDPFSHGEDAMGEVFLPEPTFKESGEHGVDQLIRLAKVHGPELTIVALGPMTNIAMAILKEPEALSNVQEIVCIAGAYGINEYGFSNATGPTPQSEWNVYVDPEACKIVFESGIPIRAIGLDIATHFDVNISEEQLAALGKSDRKEAQVLETMVRFVNSRGYQSYCALIDSMAVAAVIDPDLIEVQPLRVGVETLGELTLGQTVADFRRHHAWDNLPTINVAKSADYQGFLKLVLSTLGVQTA